MQHSALHFLCIFIEHRIEQVRSILFIEPILARLWADSTKTVFIICPEQYPFERVAVKYISKFAVLAITFDKYGALAMVFRVKPVDGHSLLSLFIGIHPMGW